MENTKTRCIASERLCDTGFSYTLSLISGKYKMTILYTLMEFTIVRYNELQRYIKGISYKTLSLSLKELENDGLIIRKEYPQIPPKVEYSLSERSEEMIFRNSFLLKSEYYIRTLPEFSESLQPPPTENLFRSDPGL